MLQQRNTWLWNGQQLPTIWVTDLRVRTTAMTWVTDLRVRTAAMTWVTGPLVRTTSMTWVTDLCVRTAFMTWVTDPLVRTTSMTWVTDLRVRTAAMTWSSSWANRWPIPSPHCFQVKKGQKKVGTDSTNCDVPVLAAGYRICFVFSKIMRQEENKYQRSMELPFTEYELHVIWFLIFFYKTL